MKTLIILILTLLILMFLVSFIANKTIRAKGRTKTISKIKFLNILEFKFETEHIEKDNET